MYTRALMSAIVVFIATTSYVSVATAQTAAPKSCLEEDRGYKLINTDGTIEPVRLYGAAVKKISASSLNGQTSAQLKQFGVATGDPREWARLFVMLCRQESGCRIARTYPDGSLEKFPTTPRTEKSYGPLQFNIGEYGLTSWAMVNSPSCTLEAFIRVAQQNKLFAYFGSMQRPSETLQHANWFNRTVQPFADALTLVFDPNAKDNSANYRALAPYFSDPYGSGAGPFGMQTSSLYPVQGAYAAQGASSGYGATPVSSLLGGQSPLGVSTNTNIQNPGSSGSGSQTHSVVGTLSAGAIMVQPQNARAGSLVLVTWTSVNMQPASCIVTKNGDEFARGNEATKRDVLESDTEYEMNCTTPSGGTATSKVVVQL